MPWILPALAFGGSTLLGASASKSAAKTQAASTDRASELQKQVADEQIALQREMFNKQMALQQPYQEAGVNALNKLQGMADYTMFGPEQFSKDPGYGFRLAEGQKTLDRQAAARGGLISGGALKAAQRYGQEMGSQEYTNAFNRYQLERNAKLGPYQSLAGVGQTAANTMGANAGQFGVNAGNALGSYGASAGNNMMAGANARASGYVGGANALSSGLNQYINYTQNQNLMNRLFPQSTGGGGSPVNFGGSGSGTFGEGDY
jgi:hypothetical protein